MAWSLRGKPTTHLVTTRLANEWRDMLEINKEREFNSERLLSHRTAAEGNKFRPVEWGKAYVKELEEWVRLNGKHTSRVFSEIDLTKINPIFVTISEFDCDTIEDAASLWATYDPKGSNRTQRDVNNTFSRTDDDLSAIDSSIIQRVVAAIDYHLSPGLYTAQNSRKRPEDKARQMIEYKDFVLWAAPFLNGKINILRRMPVVAAMMGTWQKAKNKAAEFWAAVRDATGPTPESGDRQLHEYLLGINYMNRGRGSASQHQVPAREIYCKCIHGWNAWRKGESTKLKYYHDKPIPEFGK